MTLAKAIADYIQQRKAAKLDSFQKALNKVLDKSDDPIERANAQAIYSEQAQPIEAHFDCETWLTDAAKRAKQISLATHATKFTHSDAKASSVLLDETLEVEGTQYITTASLPSKAIDVVGNAAALDVARLLKLEFAGESLIHQLKEGHINALSSFTSNKTLLNEWYDGFKLALGDSKLSSHNLSKQVYFPLKSTSDGTVEYHLLCPLFSSALAHHLYGKVRDARYGDSKEIRDARKAKKYHPQIDERFPNIAVQNFGGSKPQNISQLNNERHGQTFLLNSAPPKWISTSKPPMNHKSIFNYDLNNQCWSLIRDFRQFLIAISGKKQGNMTIRQQRDDEYMLPIIDKLLNYAALIQSMPAGWSSDNDCQLKYAHCLWLDVYNTNDAFQLEREKGDWIDIVVDDFAGWLRNQLQNEARYKLEDIEFQYFKKTCRHQLKRFERATLKLGDQ